ncbi:MULTISPECIES: hypothetical protein [Vibrio]|uniref:hypothetical protein n=1 Tax=Vibrio TaxID=662 RepID=UPI000FFBF09D|nr:MULTISPECIES: hypothetical protein [Vibrio]USD61838.1 hypothetical protein J4N45_07740 [Vibrio sp. SCSIO 43140]
MNSIMSALYEQIKVLRETNSPYNLIRASELTDMVKRLRSGKYCVYQLQESLRTGKQTIHISSLSRDSVRAQYHHELDAAKEEIKKLNKTTDKEYWIYDWGAHEKFEVYEIVPTGGDILIRTVELVERPLN